MKRAILILALVGCGAPATPSAADQAAVMTYAGNLEGCIATAKATDAGLAGYQRCKAKINALFGIVSDGGAP